MNGLYGIAQLQHALLYLLAKHCASTKPSFAQLCSALPCAAAFRHDLSRTQGRLAASLIAYLSAVQLSGSEASNGLVLPAVAITYFGQTGAVLVVIICFMAVTSSGAGEGLACSSLFTYDVYRRYIKPKVTHLPSPVWLSSSSLSSPLLLVAADCVCEALESADVFPLLARRAALHCRLRRLPLCSPKAWTFPPPPPHTPF